MEIKIKVLDVGDGDAIVVHLTKNSKDFIIVIDGGRVGDAEKVLDTLGPLLEQTGKPGPDLVICTHYDADHIGGLKKIIKTYTNNIGEIWMHQPGIIEETTRLLDRVIESRIKNVDDIAVWEIKNDVLAHWSHAEHTMIIESYGQMKTLIEIMREEGITPIEPFAGKKVKGWEEIEVLGPTRQFYDSCYAKLTPKKLLLIETEAIRASNLALNEAKYTKNLATTRLSCDYLDKMRKDHVTEINQVSIILQINAGGNKYLFTGDASLESFENIPGYPDSLKNVYWLKVPHHGSHNNSSSELFKIMCPEHAYISGGNRYLDVEVKNCLEDKNCKVMTTRDDGDLEF